MVKKVLFVFISLLTFQVLYSQNNLFSHVPFYQQQGQKAAVSSGYNLDLYYPLDTIGAVPTLTQYGDYVTTGHNIKKLWVLGDTIIVTCDFLDSLLAQSPSARQSLYQVSFDHGLSWLPGGLQVSPGGSAYPNLNSVILAGSRTVCVSGLGYDNTGRKGFAAVDVVLGAGSLTNTFLPLSNEIISFQISDSLLGCLYNSSSVVDSLFYSKFNFVNNSFSGRVFITSLSSNARNYFAANMNGQVAAAWWEPTAGDLWVKSSTDRGSTFGTPMDAIPSTTVVNGDHVCAWIAADIMYGPSGNLCVAASTLEPGFLGTARGSKIVFWSPAINGGIPVVIVDYHNVPYNCMLWDTTYYDAHYSATKQQVGMTALSNPSIAYSSDGTRMFCMYSVIQKDTASYGFFFNDISVSYSDNNGATWSNPLPIINTQNADEIYPSISRTGNSSTSISFTYSLSVCPGCASFNDTQTPVCRVYQIIKKCSPVNGCNFEPGIHTISGEIPAVYSLQQNYPNPFNPSTKIRFAVSKNSQVRIIIYDVTGKAVAEIVNQKLNPGTYEADWDALNQSSGIYFYTLLAGDFIQTKKMVLLK